MVYLKHIFIIFISLLILTLNSCSTEITSLPQRSLGNQKLELNDTDVIYNWPPKEWWLKYNNNDLNELIEYAIASSPSMEIAKTRFVTALAHIKQINPTNKIDINLVTSFDGKYASKNGTTPPPMSGKWLKSFTLGLSANYQLDLWGQNKALLSSTISLAKAQSANIENSKLLITSAIVQNFYIMQLYYIQLNLLTQQLNIQKQILYNYNQILDKGITTTDIIYTNQQVINNLELQISSLKNSINVQKNILIALVGGKDKFILSLKAKPLPNIEITSPHTLNYSLLARRADLQVQKWLVESTIGTVKAAKAAFYPTFSITGFAGLNSINLDNLLGLPSKQYSITPSIILPIFNSGMLKANFLLSQAKQNEAIANYNQAIVNALKDVCVAVSNLNAINEQIILARDNFNLSKNLLNNNYNKFMKGIISENAVLNSRLDIIAKQINLTTLIYQRVIKDVDLIKALGGGYKYN